MIVCNNLIKKYGDREVLSVESLSIKKGERVALTGPNGSGKSTLLKALSGIIPYEGEIVKNGSILYMPQRNTPFDMTVLENVTFSLKGKKRDKEERAMETLGKVGLSHLYKKNALTLSGGETARLSLARIIVRDCDVLLLDEPFAAVDTEGIEIIENAVREYLIGGERALIFSAHSPIFAKRLSDRLIMLQNGKICEDTSPDEFLSAPKTDFGKKFVDMWRYY